MAITHAQVFHALAAGGTTLVKTFTGAALAAGNAVVFFVQIATQTSGSTLTTCTLTAPGWTITQLIAPFTSATISATGYGAVFVAIAPDTTSKTFTVTWSGGTATASSFDEELCEEFTGNDQTGGTTTFDAHSSAASDTTYANLSVTPANDNDAVWFAVSDSATNAAGIYTKGADDTVGDMAEWAILSGNSGVPQTSSWTGATGAYLQVGVTIKPAPQGRIKLEGGTGNIQLESITGAIALG